MAPAGYSPRRMPDRRLSIVLPAFNEEPNVELTVERACGVARRLCTDHEVTVVDDRSTDATAGIVAKLGDRILRFGHPPLPDRGFGEALRTGSSGLGWTWCSSPIRTISSI